MQTLTFDQAYRPAAPRVLHRVAGQVVAAASELAADLAATEGEGVDLVPRFRPVGLVTIQPDRPPPFLLRPRRVAG